jgi:hypothetical protein
MVERPPETAGCTKESADSSPSQSAPEAERPPARRGTPSPRRKLTETVAQQLLEAISEHYKRVGEI